MDTLADLRAKHGLLLLFDEVQTGLGRTGKNFAYEHYGLTPDVMTLAKPLGGGLPAGAIVARADLAEVMAPGSHASTMAGGPLVAAAGRAFCKVLFEQRLAERAAVMGAKMIAALRPWVGEIPCVKEVRGLGLMIGVELDRPGAGIVERCEQRGLLVNCTANTVIRLVPPLTVSEEEIERALAILGEELRREPPA